MNKKILFIILGALLLLALMFGLWFWIFGRSASDTPANTGSFGSAGDASGLGSGTGVGGNGQAPLGNNAGVGANTGSGSQGGYTPPPTNNAPTATTSYTATPIGVIWIGNGSGYNYGTNGGGFDFDTTDINDVNSGSISGTPHITKIIGADGKEVSLASSLAVVIGGCLVGYQAQQLIIGPVITAVDEVVTNATNILTSIFSWIPGVSGLSTQKVSDSGTHTEVAVETVSHCLGRTLGRLAIQQITESTVNWINSGFDGQPSFVQDYNQFFSDVADKAAGEYIQGSGLAFLCSPFKMQIKIAIAQSYANRKSNNAGSCTLSGVVGNVEKFMNGDFAEGGWGGLIAFTTLPTNNPYGAYSYARGGLESAIAYDVQTQTLRISPGGFLSTQEPYDCGPVDPVTKKPTGCKYRTVTPGSVIEDSLKTAVGADVETLQLGDSIDQILGALSNALISKLLYSGLSNVNKAGDNTNTKATDKATALMETIQGGVTAAQQYASTKQRSIVDIQTTQQNLATLADCWSRVASSSRPTPDQITLANTNFADSIAKITDLQTKVVDHNGKIATANTSIARLQELQTDLLLATVAKDVTAVDNAYKSLQASNNPHVFSEADVTSAQQDRQTLQGGMSGINQTYGASLAQCRAITI